MLEQIDLLIPVFSSTLVIYYDILIYKPVILCKILKFKHAGVVLHDGYNVIY